MMDYIYISESLIFSIVSGNMHGRNQKLWNNIEQSETTFKVSNFEEKRPYFIKYE